ncbi:MAG TPA: ABC transporter substrate-binding protein [Candidatus Sulfotelmatobacter sp.]|nr:ABC transporter substrate-binding protein [Candidatus Sulfotelmatobacter sp.]
MKRFALQWIVISSLIVGTAAAAETRPQYGGALRVALHAALASLDPADSRQGDSFARRNLTFLLFETLVTADGRGRLHPGLATVWQAASGQTAGNQRWRLQVRRGVKFHDGTPLSADGAAASLRVANPGWKITSEADSVVIELESVDPELPAELALPRNAIVKRDPDGKLSGTGPFHITDWQAGRKLTLAAEENYWRGRPYLDTIEIELGRSFHDQRMALELGRVDLVEVAPEQSRRITTEGRPLAASEPVELVALVFAHDAQTPAEKSLRDALALSVDRASIWSVLLQGAGKPAGSILPEWLTGYGFVFPTEVDLARARREREEAKAAPTWTVRYDAEDSISHLLAERIALNAKDAGLTLQPTTAAMADLRVVRIPLMASDPWIALTEVADATGLARPAPFGGSVEELYPAEQTMLATLRLIPLLHLPTVYAASTALQGWNVGADGSWNLGDVWLAQGNGK